MQYIEKSIWMMPNIVEHNHCKWHEQKSNLAQHETMSLPY